MYSDFDGELLRELEHIDSTVTVLSTFDNGGLQVLFFFFLGGRAIGARDRALRPLLSPREIMFERGDVRAHRR